MDALRIENYDAAMLPQVAEQLLRSFPTARFFAFYGSMGVGKTTLIKSCCDSLGVEDNVCSPTFAIVNEYTTPQNESVFHFDFYRLKHIEEAYDIGCEEYFYSGLYCFVEWPELVEPLLPDSFVNVQLSENGGLRSLYAELKKKLI